MTNTTYNMQEKNEQTLSDIQGLQNIEQELFNKLNSGLTDGTLTPTQKNDIVTKINEISQMRINLYKNMNSVGSFYGENIASSNAALAEQTIAIGIVEQELNSAKSRLSELEDSSNQNMRMVQINTYYGEKYNNNTDILKSLILFCIPILFFTLLFQADMLPKAIYNILLIVFIVWGIISVGKKIIDASFRDKMNYQEYDWRFNKDSAPANDTNYDPQTSSDPWGNSGNIVCLGSNCCYAGTTYESTLNQCVPNEVAAKFSTAKEKNASSSSSKNANANRYGLLSSKFQLPQSGFGGL